MLETLVFLFWEVAVLSVAARVAIWLTARRDAGYQAEEFFALVLAADITLGSLAGQTVSLIRANSQVTYLGIAVVLLVFGARRSVAKEVFRRFSELTLWRFPVTAAVICAAVIPLLFLTLKPIDEVDSTNYLYYLLEWRANHLTPYTFSTNYVAFWEAGFLPTLVLAKNDWFFAFIAIKPVLLAGAVLWLVGEELDMAPRLRLWTVAAAMVLQYWWGSHSGVGTLKNDAAHAAGALLLVLVVLRAARGAGKSTDAALLAFGATLASVKYTGLFLSMLCCGTLLLLRVPMRRMLPGVLLFFATVGHYYVRSLLLYGNPFYPFTVHFAGITLPGTGDLTPTAISSNLANPRLWNLFFLPAHGLSPAGVLFPAVLAATVCVALWVTLANIRGRPLIFWIGVLILAGWFLFFRTFYGAGTGPNNLGFLEAGLSTLRYVEGFLALSEMFLVWLLVKRGVPIGILLGLVAIQGTSRLAILYGQPNLKLFPWFVWIAAAIGVGFVCARFPAIAPAVVLLVLVSAPWIVERNRQLWLPRWKEIYEPLRSLPPVTMFLLEDPYSGYFAMQFPLAGRHLEHDVRSSADLSGLDEARYAVRVLGEGQPQSDLDAFVSQVRSREYVPVLRATSGIILEKVVRKPLRAETASAWYLAPGTLPAAGNQTDEGGRALSKHRLAQGESVFVPPDELLRLDANVTQALDPQEGVTILLRNCGPLRDGAPAGLRYQFRAGQWWAFDHSETPAGVPFVSIEHGSYSLERMEDAEGPFVRIRAQNPAGWLAYVYNIPAFEDGAPYTATAQMRCPTVAAGCVFWLMSHAESWRHDAGQSKDWQPFRVLRRIRNHTADDHIAVGLEKVQAGDWIDVRDFGVVQGFFP